MKILLVEDDAGAREGLSYSLTSVGYQVDAVGDFVAARDYLTHSQPDILICDWQLDDPQGDGIDVVKAALQGGQPRVVMMTAHEVPVLKERAIGLPISGYLRKPVALGLLLQAIKAD